MSIDSKTTTRPSKHDTFIRMAHMLSRQSTCVRRQVGCILLNEHNHIIGSGYNGVAKDMPHCINNPCKGAAYNTGEALHKCEAIHAEQNALMQCHDVHKIHICYTTTSPCIHCIKMLMNTSCKLLVFNSIYDNDAIDLWMCNSGETNRNYILINI